MHYDVDSRFLTGFEALARAGVAARDLRNLVSVHVDVASDELQGRGDCQVALKLATEGRTPRYVATIICERVHDLRAQGIGGGHGPSLHRGDTLAFDDISDRQWEGLAVSVSDYENDALAFFCASARLEGVEVEEEDETWMDDCSRGRSRTINCSWFRP